MSTPGETIWNMDPHTEGKHLVLENYLKAWLPIISSWNKRILFIDGFAGPGIYKNHEQGSPLIALNTFKKHSNLNHSDFEISFYFIEKHEGRVNCLTNIIKDMTKELPG